MSGAKTALGRRLTPWETAACLTIAGIAAALALLGWVGPDVDAWYGAGLTRAIGERPLDPGSLGHVPKLAHLALLAPAALFGHTPERWLLALGILAFVVLAMAHWRWAAAHGMDPGRVLLALAVAPLTWRATLDATSVAWGWSCVLLALASLEGGPRRATVWLSIGALFRPEAVGAAAALALLERRHRWQALWLVAVPAVGAALGILAVDVIWTGTAGASTTAHAAFMANRLEQVRGRFGFVDTAHPWATLSFALLAAAAGSLASHWSPKGEAGSRQPSGGLRAVVPVAAAAFGWLAMTALNAAAGGVPFARFLLPLGSLLAVVAAAARLPRFAPARGITVGAFALLAAISWVRAAPEFVATFPAAEGVLVGRRLAAATPPDRTVALDAAVRAASLGSGVRPWRTTPWLLQRSDIACESQIVIARGAFLRRLPAASLAGCGPWQEQPPDSAQQRWDVHVLVRQRAR